MVSRRSLSVALALVLGCLVPGVAAAQPSCAITQITHSTGDHSGDPSLDAGSIAFTSGADLTGDNPQRAFQVFLFDGSQIIQITDGDRSSDSADLEGNAIAFRSGADLTGANPPPGDKAIFLFDGSSTVQVTDTSTGGAHHPDLENGSIALMSDADLTGGNPDRNFEIFLFDGFDITQITDTTAGSSGIPSLDGDSIAFHSVSDHTGDNAAGSLEIFLFDGSEITQITSSGPGRSSRPSLDGGSIAFESNADHTGGNPEANTEIFLFDGTEIIQVTDAPTGDSRHARVVGGSIVFDSTADLTGDNPDGSAEVFLFDGTEITQITESTFGDSIEPHLDGNSIAFASDADHTGGNPDGNREIFLASCGADPPAGPYLVSDEIPGFRFKVRITAGERVLRGVQETDCLGETLCVSGALPGRSELFLRIIGPRPNEFLWTNLVRFTPSRVEVWAEQTSTGQTNYYDLPALPRQDTELTGLVDKEAFRKGDALVAPATGVRPRPLGAPGVVTLAPFAPAPSSGLTTPVTDDPGALTFVPDAFPEFRFTVRIFAGGEERPVQIESDCIEETLCVSGALPGRSELFLRIIGPRPNGFLWTNLVRFTTSRVEVEIEQLATGERQTYVLEEVPRQSDELAGRVDREAFSP